MMVVDNGVIIFFLLWDIYGMLLENSLDIFWVDFIVCIWEYIIKLVKFIFFFVCYKMIYS